MVSPPEWSEDPVTVTELFLRRSNVFVDISSLTAIHRQTHPGPYGSGFITVEIPAFTLAPRETVFAIRDDVLEFADQHGIVAPFPILGRVPVARNRYDYRYFPATLETVDRFMSNADDWVVRYVREVHDDGEEATFARVKQVRESPLRPVLTNSMLDILMAVLTTANPDGIQFASGNLDAADSERLESFEWNWGAQK